MRRRVRTESGQVVYGQREDADPPQVRGARRAVPRHGPALGRAQLLLELVVEDASPASPRRGWLRRGGGGARRSAGPGWRSMPSPREGAGRVCHPRRPPVPGATPFRPSVSAFPRRPLPDAERARSDTCRPLTLRRGSPGSLLRTVPVRTRAHPPHPIREKGFPESVANRVDPEPQGQVVSHPGNLRRRLAAHVGVADHDAKRALRRREAV